MGEIINPYIAGAPVTETKMFFGREDVFDWIQNSLVGKYTDHILVIHGQRRVGKTSVLKQLGNRLPEKYISVFFDLQGRTHTNLDRFLWWLAREIVHVLKQERNIEVALPEKEAFALDAEYFENRFLPGLQPALGDHTLILTFDEFDNLEESEIKESLARPLVDYLRRMMGRQGLNFIFSIGSSGRKLENMQAAYTEFFKAALYKKISFLSEEQTRHLITRPVEGVLEYEPAAVDRIYKIASGHPYFTQLTCHELFARCQRTGQRKIAQSDVDAILEDVVERGTVNLKFVWDEASDLEKWGLAALAHLEEKAQSSAVAAFLSKQHLRFSESDLTSGMLHLREKDVLTSDNRFVIYLLRLWLQKNRPIEQVREELTEVNPIANRYIEIGLEFKNAGTYDKAFESFQEALAVDSDNIQAQVNIGLVYMDQKAYARAIVEFEKALTIDDEDVTARSGLCEAHLALGDTALQKGRTRDAVQSYQRVLSINAEHTEARGRMAEIQRLRAEKALTDGREDEAIAAFVEALKFTPEDEALVKRYEQALVERRTKMVTDLLAKAEKEQSARNWEGAFSILTQAEKIDPGNKIIQSRLSAIQSEQHQVQLTNILSRADRAEAAGRWKQAISILEEYVLLEPDNEKVNKRLEAARNSYQEARLEEARGRTKSLARQERFEEALAVWEIELKNHPEQRPAILAELEKLNQVKVQAQAEQRKQQLGAILGRAVRAEAAGRWDQAIVALEEYLRLEPVDEEVQKRLEDARRKQTEIQVEEIQTKAHNLARQERFEEALAAWQELLKLAPDQAPAIQAEIARLEPAQALAKAYVEAQQAYAKKDYDQAVSLLKGIIIKDENYKDSSRLLSQAIELRRARHKWWQNKWLWGIVGSAALVLVVWFGYQPGARLVSKLFTADILATRTLVAVGTQSPIRTQVIYNGSPTTKTSITSITQIQALTWIPLNNGQFLSRDLVTSIVLDPNDTKVIYLGTRFSGIYKSMDAGASWQPIHNGLGRESIYTIIMDPRDSKTLFSATALGGVYKTTNIGLIWQAKMDGIDLGGKDWGNTIVMDPQNSQHLYYSNLNYLYETQNAGQSWQKLDAPGNCPSYFNGLVLDPTDDHILYTSGGGASGNTCQPGLYKSIDGGKTWTRTNLGAADQGNLSQWTNMWIEPKGAKSLFANWANKLWVSNDKGLTWAESYSTSCYTFVFDTQDSSTAFCTANAQNNKGIDVLQTTDVGKTWKIISSSVSGQPISMAISPMDNKTMVLGTTSGVNISLDGGKTWEEHNNGLGGNAWELRIAVPDSTDLLAKGLDSRLYLSKDLGQSWNDIGASQSLAYNTLGKTMYAMLKDGYLAVSRNNSAAWEQIALPASGTQAIEVHPINPDRVYALYGRNSPPYIYYSDDLGKTWLASTGMRDIFKPRLFFDHDQGNRVYAFGDLEGSWSNDSGVTWHNCGNYPQIPGSTNIWGSGYDANAVVDWQNSDYVFVATQGSGIMTSTDGCNTWQLGNTGLSNLFVNTLAIDPTYHSEMYAATDTSPYISIDNGKTWNLINNGLPYGTVVYSIMVTEGYVFATTSYGFFRLEQK